MLQANGIDDAPTTVQNPQADAICERLHQTIATSLQTIVNHHPPHNADEVDDIVDTCLKSASYATRATIHHTLNPINMEP